MAMVNSSGGSRELLFSLDALRGLDMLILRVIAPLLMTLAASMACAARAAVVEQNNHMAHTVRANVCGGHQFSMSFKVTALNGELATAAGRERAFKWLKARNIRKVWLETYRHNEYVPTERLKAARDDFRRAGFEVNGLITYTMLNDPPTPEGERDFCCCYTDPKARERCRAEAERAAGIFDTLLLDDFMFTICTCDRCRAAMEQGGYGDDWGAFRRELMTGVLTDLIDGPAKALNPRVQVIVKYQCWYDGWFETGDDPAVQAARLGACWIGTETRDNCEDALKACWINDFIAALTGDRCRGAWYDPLDCSPSKYIEQARYTILGGARESLVHCWDYLVADDPGKVPFGQSPNNGHACCVPFERECEVLQALSRRLDGAVRGNYEMGTNGVSRHEFFKGGEKLVATMDTRYGTLALESAGPAEPPTVADFRGAAIDLSVGSELKRWELKELAWILEDPSRAFNLFRRADGRAVLRPKLPPRAMEMLIWSHLRARAVKSANSPG